ncbi:MAG: serine/threonine protein kinase [Betaproteobacteria bacterium]|nr:serine/threonine protein kinase [Betaproteobacteria bacterium]
MHDIGKYPVRSVIISTDFATLYLCSDPDLRVDVAVKRFDLKGSSIAPDAKYDAGHWRERFMREARVLAQFDHPCIVPVKELSQDGEGRPYFVMPYLEANLIYEIGRDDTDRDEIARLPERLRPRQLAPTRAVFILRQMLQGLAEVHRRGLVHRDVKPGNVLLTSKRGGSVKLCDFGVVKFPDWNKSRAGVWLGTLDYIAPEQRENAAGVDARADVYSAAAVAYRMLSGHLPAGRFPSLSEIGLGLPGALDDLLMASLSPQKQSRPADASEMLTKLDEAVRGLAAPPRRVARVVSITRNGDPAG